MEMLWITYLLNVNVSGSIAIAKDALSKSNQVILVLDKLVPNNVAVNILKTIEVYAQKNVSGTEQLYKSIQLSTNERLRTPNLFLCSKINKAFL